MAATLKKYVVKGFRKSTVLPLEETLVSLRKDFTNRFSMNICRLYPVMTPFWSGIRGGAQVSVTLVLVEVTRRKPIGWPVGAGYID